jgi:hypothetical protein
MTNTDFLIRLHVKYPEAKASKHGEVANGRTETCVSVTFVPGCRSYDYSGSYVSILCGLGLGPEWVAVSPYGEYCGLFWTEVEAQTAVDHQKSEAIRNGLATRWTVLHTSGG